MLRLVIFTDTRSHCLILYQAICDIFQGGDSDFIFPEGASTQRGRFELAFSQIGGSVFVGNAFCYCYAYVKDSLYIM